MVSIKMKSEWKVKITMAKIIIIRFEVYSTEITLYEFIKKSIQEVNII